MYNDNTTLDFTCRWSSSIYSHQSLNIHYVSTLGLKLHFMVITNQIQKFKKAAFWRTCSLVVFYLGLCGLVTKLNSFCFRAFICMAKPPCFRIRFWFSVQLNTARNAPPPLCFKYFPLISLSLAVSPANTHRTTDNRYEMLVSPSHALQQLGSAWRLPSLIQPNSHLPCREGLLSTCII